MNKLVHVDVGDGQDVPCVCAAETAIHVGDQWVIEADRVPEFGKVTRIEDPSEGAGSAKHPARLLRRATLQDLTRANEDALMSRIAANTFQAKLKAKGVTVRVVRVRYSFDRSVLRITYSSEDRVDFGSTIQELSTELRARVEMKQIGVRDEAGLIGGMGPCGRKLCCCSWLKRFESINIRMAKSQRVSLNPSAISGLCGRLKCCLKYEYETYRDLGRAMPRDGAEVTCPDGKGCVIDKSILRGRVRVRLQDDRIMDYPVGEVTVGAGGRKEKRSENDEDSALERAEPESARET